MIAADVILLGLVAKHGVREGVRECLRVFPSLSAMDEWDESKHPRKDNGQFGTGSGEKQQEKVKNSSEELYQKAYERILSEVTPEVRKKMEAVKIDFSQDNVLPQMNKEDADYLGIKVRPFRLKKEIIERQGSKHPLSNEKAQILLSCALYNPEYIGGERDNGCVNFITYLRHNRNPLVLVDVKESEEGYYDIVHYYFLDEKSNKKKRAEKEGRENHS